MFPLRCLLLGYLPERYTFIHYGRKKTRCTHCVYLKTKQQFRNPPRFHLQKRKGKGRSICGREEKQHGKRSAGEDRYTEARTDQVRTKGQAVYANRDLHKEVILWHRRGRECRQKKYRFKWGSWFINGDSTISGSKGNSRSWPIYLMGLCPADSRQGGCWCVPKYLRWERPEGTESSPYVCFLCIYFYLVHFLLLWYTIFLPIPLSHVKISCSSWTKIRFIKTYFKVKFFSSRFELAIMVKSVSATVQVPDYMNSKYTHPYPHKLFSTYYLATVIITTQPHLSPGFDTSGPSFKFTASFAHNAESWITVLPNTVPLSGT